MLNKYGIKPKYRFSLKHPVYNGNGPPFHTVFYFNDTNAFSFKDVTHYLIQYRIVTHPSPEDVNINYIDLTLRAIKIAINVYTRVSYYNAQWLQTTEKPPHDCAHTLWVVFNDLHLT